MELLEKSEYLRSLSKCARERYTQKTTLAGLATDPYCLSADKWDKNPENLPNLGWSDVVMYMINTPSQYTKESLKAWKGMLDSNGFVTAGWVYDLLLHHYLHEGQKKYLIKAKVNHSQRTCATPLLPWVIIDEHGSVNSAHCTCMAGLGEACSHVAAVLTSVVKAVEIIKHSGLNSCTSTPCYWLPQSKKVAAADISEITYKTSTRGKRSASSSATASPSKINRLHSIPKPSQEELQDFLKLQNDNAKQKPAILKLFMPFAENFVPRIADKSFPIPLSQLYNPSMLAATYLELICECEKIFSHMKVTQEEAVLVEMETRGQATNKGWYEYRAGRLTASLIRAISHTNPAMPSPSLIKRICYPQLHNFSTKATRYGCDHEKEAIEAYKTDSSHTDLHIHENGLFIDTTKPYLGASPDGLTSCSCCEGKGVLEVKCPLCVKDEFPSEAVDTCHRPSFCMIKENGTWTLEKNHPYFYQIQAQMHVCNRPYCDFVVWSETCGILKERVSAEPNFIEDIVDKLENFFVYGVLPEIVGKWYTRQPVSNNENIVENPQKQNDDGSSTSADDEDYTKCWCYCSQPSHGQMIQCDNQKCTIVWFHCDCLRIRKIPKGSWKCPSCRRLPKTTKKKCQA